MAAAGGCVAAESCRVKERDPLDPTLAIIAQSKAEYKRKRQTDRRADTFSLHELDPPPYPGGIQDFLDFPMRTDVGQYCTQFKTKKQTFF